MPARSFFLKRQWQRKAIDKITSIHTGVEESRGARILIGPTGMCCSCSFTIRLLPYELLERKLTDVEKQDLFDTFYRMGTRMGLKGLPADFKEWVKMREDHLQQDLEKSYYTTDLYKQYRKHLGFVRYQLLIESHKSWWCLKGCYNC